MDLDRQRLDALLGYEILDTAPEPEFDDIVQVAATVCATPVALISFVSSERQWFKARVGFDACETPLSQSVCVHALEVDDLMVIPDLTLDQRTRTNSLVTAGPKIRFYAGAVLRSLSGIAIGTLCVIDAKPRPHGLSKPQADTLRRLAAVTMRLLEMRLTIDKRDEAIEAARRIGRASFHKATASEESHKAAQGSAVRLRIAQEAGGVGTFDVDIGADIAEVSPAMCRIFGLPEQATYPVAHFEALCLPQDRTLQSSREGRMAGTAASETEYRIRRADDRSLRWVVRRGEFIDDVERASRRFMGTVQDITDRKLTEERNAAILGLGDRLRSMDDPTQMAFLAAELIGRALDSTRAGQGSVDPVLETVDIGIDWNAPGVASIAGIHAFRAFGSFITDLQAGRTVVIEDTDEDPRTRDKADAMRAIGTRSLVNIPLLERETLTAVILVHDRQPRIWSAAELDFIKSMGDRAQAAIEQVRTAARQRILNEELNHRLKNTLTIVSGIASQTLRSAADKDRVRTFEQRIIALSRAHDILLQRDWSGARIRAVIEAGLAPHAEAERVDLAGPNVHLGGKAAMSLSLLLHELATNALKYGALSSPDGRVRLHWDVAGVAVKARLAIVWTEENGPPVSIPQRRGFGSRLIGMGLSGSGTAEIRYDPAGLVATFSTPLADIAEGG